MMTIENLFRKESGFVNYSLDKIEYDYSVDKKGADQLLVFLPSAIAPGNQVTPFFHRWKWGKYFEEFDTLAVADPTLRLNREMLGGWLQASKESWATEHIAETIAALASHMGYKKVVFSGSSSGGFVAIQMAILLESYIGDLRVHFYAENPQIDLNRYHMKRHMDLLAQVVYNVNDIAGVPSEFVHRINLLEMVERYNLCPKGVIITKESDNHHFTHHHKVFESYLKGKSLLSCKFKSISTEADPTGHTPLSIHEMKAEISELVA